jgi:hypothetical protein
VDGKTLWAAGMGISNRVTNAQPSRLQEIELEYVSDDACREESKLILSNGDATLCSRHRSVTGGVCFGDSGGPLYDNENQVLVGITSYGLLPECASPTPEVFGRVSDKFSWIKSIICAESQSASICNQTAKPTTSPAPTSQWCDDAQIEITINPDLFPDENVFYIKDMQSNQILTGSSLEGFASDVTHGGNLCLPASNQECYAFTIIDYYGDGIDLGGTDPDYCIKLNGQIVSCNVDFTGSVESVIFPEESCSQACAPSYYNLDITTTRAADFKLIITDDSGNEIVPYNFNIGSSYSAGTVPVELCRGCYQLFAENFRYATFSLTDKKTNEIVISDSQFSQTSVVAFSVGGVEGCEVKSDASALLMGGSSTIVTVLHVVSLFMAFMMTSGVF